MRHIIRLLILAGIIYGIYWVYQNVDFDALKAETTEKIKNEKTITRVTNGRARAIEDTRKVTE